MRPYWKGYLKLALVSCPIALHAACSTAERIAFRQINEVTGNRLRQQLIDEETREPIAPEHKGRGYEVAKGQYLMVEDEELEAIEIESTHTIDIVQPPGIGISPMAVMDALQTIVTAALATKSSAETPRKACWDARSIAMRRELAQTLAYASW